MIKKPTKIIVPGMCKAVFAIGIDPGINTGMAIYNRQTKKIEKIFPALSMSDAQEHLLSLAQEYPGNILVIVEDARKKIVPRKFRKPERAYGAGHVRAMCLMWDDFLSRNGFSYMMVTPRGIKLSKWDLEKYTGYVGLTSQHGRDAAMLVFNL